MGVNVREKPKGSGIWWVFVRHQGIRKSKRIGTSRGLADEVAEKVQAKLVLGDLGFLSDVPTFKEHAETFLNEYSRHNHKTSTHENYQMAIKKHFLPVFGDRPLNEIKKKDIKAFLFKKRDEGLKYGTVQNLRRYLSSIFSRAKEDEIIPTNPVAQTRKCIRKPEKPDREIKPYSWEEKNTLEATVKEHFPARDYALLLTALRTGIRIGEIVALRPEDLDFEGMFIKVKRNYVRGRLTSTKSDRVRKVDMSPQLAQVLKDYLTERKKEALKKKWGKPPEWLFYSQERNILNPDNLNRRIFKKWIEKAGLRRVTFHGLRHTYATLRLLKGDDVLDVSKQLGHENIQTTTQTYLHWIPGTKKGQVAELDLPAAPSGTPMAPNEEQEAVNA